MLRGVSGPCNVVRAIRRYRSFDVCHSRSDANSYRIAICPIFSNVRLICCSMRVRDYSVGLTGKERVLVVARYRRNEVRFRCGGNRCLCLTSNSLSVRGGARGVQRECYPLDRCRNISITVSVGHIPEYFSYVLSSIFIDPGRLRVGFYSRGPCSVVHRGVDVRRVFSRLCSIPRGVQGNCRGIGILRLLLFLDNLRCGNRDRREQCFSHSRIATTGRTGGCLLTRLSRRVAVARLTSVLNVSSASLGVYFGNICNSAVGNCVAGYGVRGTTSLLGGASGDILRVTKVINCGGNDGFTNTFEEIVGGSPGRCEGSLI